MKTEILLKQDTLIGDPLTNTLPKNLDKVLIVAVFTTFMGQIYIRPFGTDFRLTLAVVVLNVLMLTLKSIPPVATINLVGLLMRFIRSAVFSFKANVPLYLFLGLWICDSIPNIIEVLVRGEWQSGEFEGIVLTITAIGLLRTLFTVTLIHFSQYYYSRLKKRKSINNLLNASYSCPT